MIKIICRIIALGIIGLMPCIIHPNNSSAIGVDKPLVNAGDEARARALYKELRCLVCQNQAIDDSNADLARDLRFLVRERIERGESDEEILDYVVGRYGDWILLNPAIKFKTLVLWLGPLLLLILGSTMAVRLILEQKNSGLDRERPLTRQEKQRLRKVLDDKKRYN